MDNRTLILLMVFSFSLIMLWDAWHIQNDPNKKQQQSQVQKTASTITNQPNIPAPTTDLSTDKTDTPLPSSSSLLSDAAVGTTLVKIETDLYIAFVSPVGGNIVKQELKRYRDPEDKSKPLLFIDPIHRYALQSGLGNGLPNHQTLFNVIPGSTTLADSQDSLELKLEAVSDSGVKVTKIYRFKRNSYLIDLNFEIENPTEQEINSYAYFQIQRDGGVPAGESRMLSTFTGPAVYTDNSYYQKVTFADIEKGKASYAKNADNGWLAMVQHYFVSAWIIPQGIQREYYMNRTKAGLFDIGMIISTGVVAAKGGKTNLSTTLYSGPQEQERLKVADEKMTLVVDYGWLTVIAAPLFWVLQFIHKLVNNWGWAIVGLTLLIKLLFYPLSAASYKSMAKMSKVSPKMQQLKELYGNDRQRLQQEMMSLYRNEKINPLGGCLPILVQIPVFIALYWVLLGAVEMRDAEWMLWIHDLSKPDPFFVLPIIMMASMFIQFKLNPTPPDPIQAKVMMFMPLIFGIMFFFFPSGLVLYWVVNNILSIIQQWYIKRSIDVPNKVSSYQKLGKR